jgi:hypothetical protein
LFSRTGNPEFGLTGKRPQRFDSSRPTASPRLYEGQDVADLIVVDADDQCRQSRAAHRRISFDLRRGRSKRGKIRQERLRIRRLDDGQD